jgi:hypothetical protein
MKKRKKMQCNLAIRYRNWIAKNGLKINMKKDSSNAN